MASPDVSSEVSSKMQVTEAGVFLYISRGTQTTPDVKTWTLSTSQVSSGTQTELADFGDFVFFPKLPTAIRHKVWNATVDYQPRILPRKRITELEVCHESRTVLLRVYKQCFAKPSERKKYSAQNAKRALYMEQMMKYRLYTPSIYANFESDVLLFDNDAQSLAVASRGDLRTLLAPDSYSMIKYFAVDPAGLFKDRSVFKWTDSFDDPPPLCRLTVLTPKNIFFSWIAEPFDTVRQRPALITRFWNLETLYMVSLPGRINFEKKVTVEQRQRGALWMDVWASSPDERFMAADGDLDAETALELARHWALTKRRYPRCHRPKVVVAGTVHHKVDDKA